MNKYSLSFIFVISFLWGCAASKITVDKAELAAAAHMNIADSLSAKSAFRKATNEYLLITKQYKTTSYYADAVYHAAVLFSNPLNPSASDSASLYWFKIYLTLPIPDQQKEKAVIYISMLERIKLLREELQKLREVDVQVNKRGTKK